PAFTGCLDPCSARRRTDSRNFGCMYQVGQGRSIRYESEPVFKASMANGLTSTPNPAPNLKVCVNATRLGAPSFRDQAVPGQVWAYTHCGVLSKHSHP